MPDITSVTSNAGGEDEFLDIILSIFPDTWDSWIALIVIVCAILAAILPAPSKRAHAIWKSLHKVITWIGTGATKLKKTGKLATISKIGGLIKRRNKKND